VERKNDKGRGSRIVEVKSPSGSSKFNQRDQTKSHTRRLTSDRCQSDWCLKYFQSAIAAANFNDGNKRQSSLPGESWRDYLIRIDVDDGLRASARFLTPWLTNFLEFAHMEAGARPKSRARNICLSAFDTSLQNCSRLWSELIGVVYPELETETRKRVEVAAALTCPVASAQALAHSSVRGTENGQIEASHLVCRLRELTSFATTDLILQEQCRSQSNGTCAHTRLSRSSRALLDIARVQDHVPCSLSSHYSKNCANTTNGGY
jgi:hypothetical protein